MKHDIDTDNDLLHRIAITDVPFDKSDLAALEGAIEIGLQASFEVVDDDNLGDVSIQELVDDGRADHPGSAGHEHATSPHSASLEHGVRLVGSPSPDTRRGLSVDPNHTVFVHPNGLCESTEIGPNTRIWAFAHVMQGARVGAGCNIGDHAFIESGATLGANVTVKNAVLVWRGVTIEDDVFLGPNCVFTNDLRPRSKARKAESDLLETMVRRNATIGANATILCGLEIGCNAFVAAGAVVVHDVAPHELVAGNPASRVGWVCACGERLDAGLRCVCGCRYRTRSGGSGLEPLPPS